MGISRDSVHKRRATGGRQKRIRMKRKFEMGRQSAATKIGDKKVNRVRVRGGHFKFRALRLEQGNFTWAGEAVTRKTRILKVAYNCTNNELVRTNTLVKGCIVLIDSAPFKAWYSQYYDYDLSGKKQKVVIEEKDEKTEEKKPAKGKATEPKKEEKKVPEKKGAEKKGEKGAEKKGAEKKGAEKKGEKGAEKKGEKGAEKKGEKGAEKKGEKGAEKKGEKGAEKKGAEKKTEKGAEKKGTDKKGGDKKGDDKKGADKKGDDKKGADKKGDDKKGADKKGGDKKVDDKKAGQKKEEKKEATEEQSEAKQKSKSVIKKLARRNKTRVLEDALAEQFKVGKVYARLSSRPGQCGRADGYILEGEELAFYLKKINLKKKK